jgi:hypothetical protein
MAAAKARQVATAKAKANAMAKKAQQGSSDA